MSDATRALWRIEARKVRAMRSLEQLDTLHSALSSLAGDGINIVLYRMHLYDILGLDDYALLAELEKMTRINPLRMG